jgi:hypothetical protein
MILTYLSHGFARNAERQSASWMKNRLYFFARGVVTAHFTTLVPVFRKFHHRTKLGSAGIVCRDATNAQFVITMD